jgi:hypothetical protein
VSRNEQQAAQIVRLLQQASEALASTHVEERTLYESRALRSALEVALQCAFDFETENSTHTAD